MPFSKRLWESDMRNLCCVISVRCTIRTDWPTKTSDLRGSYLHHRRSVWLKTTCDE